MNTENISTQQQFCIWCGNEIKVDSNFCPKCGKKQIYEENQLVDWLIAHTKDKLKGDAESSLFDAIKNFILSHLYGTIMSIAIIAAVGITVYASEPYIEKYRDADKPGYITDNINSTPVQNRPSMDNSMVRTICNDYLSIIESSDNNPADPVYGLTVPASFPYKSEFNLVYDAKFVSSNRFYLRDSGSKILSEPEEFTFDISKEMYDDGYSVAEYVKEQYMEDASSAEKVYTRTIAFSCVEIDGKPYIAATEVTEFDENEYYKWPIEVDESKLIATVEGYIKAIFAGEDVSAYEFPLPADFNATPSHKAYTMPDLCPDFKEIEKINLNLYQRGSYLASATELEGKGYDVVGADIVITCAKQTEGRTMQTSHSFAFVVQDGNYYIIDDHILSTTHAS